MLAVLLGVLGVSFSGVMLPGPMFAVALAKSFRSPWTGIQMSLGHAVIEVPLILVIYLGFSRFFHNEFVRFGLSIAGGAVVAWMGVSLLRARAELAEERRDSPYSAFVAGITLTALNPFFILWWATIGSALLMKFLDYSRQAMPLFITTHLLADVAWLSFVSVLTFKTHRLWSKGLQKAIFTACALLLVGFGAWFVVSGIQTII